MNNVKILANGVAVGLALVVTTMPALAGPIDAGGPLPAPGIFGLVAAAVIGVVALSRLRRNIF